MTKSVPRIFIGDAQLLLNRKVRVDSFTPPTLGAGFPVVHQILDTDFTNDHEFNSWWLTAAAASPSPPSPTGRGLR